MCSVDRWVSGVCCVWVSHSIRIGCFRLSAFYLHRLACAMWTSCWSSIVAVHLDGRSFELPFAIPQMKLEQMTAMTQMHKTQHNESSSPNILKAWRLRTRFLVVFCNIYLLCALRRWGRATASNAHVRCTAVSISQAHPILTYGVDFISLLLLLYWIRVGSHCWLRNGRPKT